MILDFQLKIFSGNLNKRFLKILLQLSRMTRNGNSFVSDCRNYELSIILFNLKIHLPIIQHLSVTVLFLCLFFPRSCMSIPSLAVVIVNMWWTASVFWWDHCVLTRTFIGTVLATKPLNCNSFSWWFVFPLHIISMYFWTTLFIYSDSILYRKNYQGKFTLFFIYLFINFFGDLKMSGVMATQIRQERNFLELVQSSVWRFCVP